MFASGPPHWGCQHVQSPKMYSKSDGGGDGGGGGGGVKLDGGEVAYGDQGREKMERCDGRLWDSRWERERVRDEEEGRRQVGEEGGDKETG